MVKKQKDIARHNHIKLHIVSPLSKRLLPTICSGFRSVLVSTRHILFFDRMCFTSLVVCLLSVAGQVEHRGFIKAGKPNLFVLAKRLNSTVEVRSWRYSSDLIDSYFKQK